ncbi:protein of unknown function DUF86 [Candidatus Desulforudis audaxviator MP104C]|uniref:DUF86 domain-containing protein n=2 Tax=Candidatus Desulforudis TaxID=471826 RepID=B1I1Y9_DESAP|nr:protein of unknown function DUF86 [Candidatus Desulforudis audaxviator MP104C]AZK58942.1 protein of unknown function DUF86 [Candidatus Desulforudis audaxviator]
MMVADVELIRGKLTELETYVRELENLQAYTLDELRTNLPRLWSVIHGLQLSIQILLDVGNHLLADLGVKARDYTEIIDKLGEMGVLPAEFAEEIRGMAGFRNVLVHGYASLDIARVHQTLHNNLNDFLKFAHHRASGSR